MEIGRCDEDDVREMLTLDDERLNVLVDERNFFDEELTLDDGNNIDDESAGGEKREARSERREARGVDEMMGIDVVDARAISADGMLRMSDGEDATVTRVDDDEDKNA